MISETYKDLSKMTDDPERMNDLVTEFLQCLTCRKICKPPIWQCINSHKVCANCRSHVKVCEICKAKFCRGRDILAQKLSELVKVPCKFAKNGCDMRMEQRLMDEHIIECSFKIRCQLKEYSSTNKNWAVPCPWLGTEEDLFLHVVDEHPGFAAMGPTLIHSFPIRHKVDARFFLFESQSFWSMIVYNFKTHTMQGMVFRFSSQTVESRYGFSYKLHDGLFETHGDVMNMTGLNVELKNFFDTNGPSVLVFEGHHFKKAFVKHGIFECDLAIYRK